MRTMRSSRGVSEANTRVVVLEATIKVVDAAARENFISFNWGGYSIFRQLSAEHLRQSAVR